MAKRAQIFLNQLALSKAIRTTADGVDYLVVPAIAAKEGVMNGKFYSAAELEMFANTWNGVPVPVGHPKDADGNFVSANSPDVESTANIGRFYNVSFSTNSSTLQGELWINIDKATRLGFGELVTRLEGGEIMNVSTGLFSNMVDEVGEFDGVPYSQIATNIRPDHLALLPNELGACSVSDGCGTHLYANCADMVAGGTCPCKTKPPVNKSVFGAAFNAIKSAFGISTNEVSHDEIRSQLRALITNEQGSQDPWPYVMDVYDKFFVYELGNVLFKRGYATDAADVCTLVGDKIQVMIKREYVPVPTTNSPTTNNQNMKTHIVAALAALVANNLMTKDQATAMESLKPEALDALFPEAPITNAVVPAVPVTNAAVPSPLTPTERELLTRLVANEEQRLATLRANVAKNFPGLTTDAISALNGQALDALVSTLPANVVDFSLAGGGGPAPVTNSNPHTPTPILLRKD